MAAVLAVGAVEVTGAVVVEVVDTELVVGGLVVVTDTDVDDPEPAACVTVIFIVASTALTTIMPVRLAPLFLEEKIVKLPFFDPSTCDSVNQDESLVMYQLALEVTVILMLEAAATEFQVDGDRLRVATTTVKVAASEMACPTVLETTQR